MFTDVETVVRISVLSDIGKKADPTYKVYEFSDE